MTIDKKDKTIYIKLEEFPELCDRSSPIESLETLNNIRKEFLQRLGGYKIWHNEDIQPIYFGLQTAQHYYETKIKIDILKSDK
ncbi:MAG: hypothetical protein ACP5N1_05735 [Candidatus Woesearchaeota archaeon]